MTRRAAQPVCYRCRLRGGALIVCVLLSFWWVATVAAQGIPESEQQFVAGLRARGLYDLASTYCRQQINTERPYLEQAGWRAEFSRTLAAQARALPEAERAPVWEAAIEALEVPVDQNAPAAGSEILHLERGLVHLQRGQLHRLEAEAAGDTAPVDEARQELRQASEQLHAVDERLDARLRGALSGPNRAATNASDGLNEWQLRRLQGNARFQRAVAQRELAATYPSQSADRVAAAGQAADILGPLAEKGDEDPLAWESRLALLDAWRLLGRSAETRSRAQQLLPKLPPSLRPQLLTTLVLLELEEEQLETAQRLLESASRIAPESSPQLDDARLQTLLIAARSQSQSANNAGPTAGQQAAKLADQIGFRWGAMWGRLAQSRIGSGLVAGSGDLELLVRSAESLYRGGRIDEALAAYDQAREAATADPQQAFKLAFVAATIEHQRENYAAAAERYEAAALAHPEQADAPQAHLLSAYDLAAVLRGTPNADLTPYQQRLEAHLRQWPSDVTADQAALWLGKLHEARRQWMPAIEAYALVRPESESFPETMQNIAHSYQELLAAQTAAGEPTEPLARQAADAFREVIVDSADRWPQRWSPVDRAAGLAAVKLWLRYVPAANLDAVALLDAALQADGRQDPDWTAAAQLWLAVAHAKRGNMSRAEQLLPQVPVPVGELLEALEVLGPGRDIATEKEAASIALGQLEQLTRANPEMTAADRQRAHRLQAAALVRAGRGSEAVGRYRELVRQQPRDVELLRGYADLLVSQGEANEAVSVWQQLEKATTKGSPDWFEAKLQLARLHGQLGSPQRGLQIIQVTEVLHPELGGPEMKARFEQVKSELGRR